MVVDTSVILAIFFNEPQGTWAADHLNQHAMQLRMSTVNLTEALILLQDRQPALYPELEEQLFTSGIRFVPPDTVQARIAARARISYPLNMGDCFAYALAVAENCPILTLDADFLSTDRPILIP